MEKTPRSVFGDVTVHRIVTAVLLVVGAAQVTAGDLNRDVRYQHRAESLALEAATPLMYQIEGHRDPDRRVIADVREDAKRQLEFGIAVATRGLWREAIYRWQRAVEIDPSYAEAYNDLAIAHEHEGEFDKARTAYEKALELEPNNAVIKQNYELFKEINDRASSNGDR